MKEKYTTSVLRTPTGSVARRNKLLLLLTCAAGYVDAVSYLQLGHVFTANMTGNTVLLGLSLIERNAPAAVRSGLAVGGFLAGAASVRGIGYCDDLHHRNSHQSNDPHREFAAA